MAQATEQEVRDMFTGGLSSVSSDTIQLYLSDAYNVVIDHDIAVTNSKFSQLQRYMTAHLMSIGNIGDIKGVESERVADVSITYGDVGSNALKTLYTTNWEREFYKCLVQIQGLACRML